MGRNIVRGFLSIFGADMGKLALSMAITPIIVRVLGSSGYGDYAFLLSVLGITMIFVNSGIFDGVRKYVAENRDVPDWQTNVFVFYLRVAVVVALLAALLAVGVTQFGFVQSRFGAEYELYFYLLAGIIVVRQLGSLGRGTLMGLGYEKFSEPLRLVRVALMGLIGVPLAAVGYGVAGMLAGRLLSRAIVSGATIGLVFRKITPSSVTNRMPDDFPRRELVSFNTLSVVLILLLMSLYHVDVIVLRTLKGSTMTGYYKAALVIAEMIWFVPQALQMVLLHSTSELWSEDHGEYVTELASRATRYTLLLTILLAIGLLGLADVFVPLYFGSDFAPATTPLLLLLPGTIGFAVVRPTIAITQGKGVLRTLIYATGIASVINLALNLALIPRYGMTGAAIATSVGYGSMFLLHVKSARTVGFDPLADVRFGRILLTAVPSAAVILLLSEVITSGYVALAVVPITGLLVYAGLAIYVGAVDADELDQLADRLPLGRVPFISPE